MGSFADFPEILLKLAVSVLLGGIIGWEREVHDRPAGLRTHVLVCVGSAVYMILSMSFPGTSDPSRIAAQVATGMGFLGAGTIIRHGNAVRGLTTAASLWAVAAIGLSVGRGEAGYMIAASTTIVVFLTLRGLTLVEKAISKRRYRMATLRVSKARETMPSLQALLETKGVQIKSCEILEPDAGGISGMKLFLRLPSGVEPEQLTNSLSSHPEVRSIEWD
jgi:putative Mg2+ transporter-C (MgtC) family protein